MFRPGLILLLSLASAAWGQTISTIAGGGTGDGNAATQAYLNLPVSLVMDSRGNLLVVDQNDHRIRKVTSGGIISTFAGTGVPGFADGAAAQAQFNFPAAVRVDASGNVYVADALNNRIRKIDAAGNVTTFAGTGTAGDSGDLGPASSAQLRTPFGVAVDGSGNVYIADSNNNRIKRVNSSGIISTVVGTGSPGFSGDGGPGPAAQLNFPQGLAVDSAGNLYIADSGNARIRKLDLTGKITTVVGTGVVGSTGDGGPATQARLANPQDVAFAPDGSLYLADAFPNSRVALVRRVDVQGVITTVAGVPGQLGQGGDSGPATSALLFNPVGVAVDPQGRFYIADSGNRRVRAVESGIIRTFAGGSVLDGGPATSAGLAGPNGVRADLLGNVFIADSQNHRIRQIDSAGVIRTVAGNGLPTIGGDGGPATSASLNSPQGIALDASRNLYIADAGNHRIRKVTPAGVISTIAGTGSSGYSASEDGGPATKARLSLPNAVALDSSGNIFIADRGNGRVRKIDAATGNISTFAGNGSRTLCGVSLSCGDNGPATSASFADPRDVALDVQGNVYVADASSATSDGRLVGGFRIRQIDSTGTIRTVAGNGQADAGGDNNLPTSAAVGVPSGIALDRAGALFLADERNHRIRKVVLGGTITTLAGSTAGFSGDGGPSTAAQLTTPRGLSVDTAGNLLIADSGNNRVRQIAGVAGVTPRRLALVSGDRQSAAVGSQLPQPLVVALLDGTTPVANVAVQFAASPASAVDLSPTQTTTDSGGKASTMVTFKDQVGAVTVTATSSGVDPVTFTVTAVPRINAGGVVNGASFTGTTLAPGAIASLFGIGLTNTTDSASALPLPSKLANMVLRVQTSSRALEAPLFFASPKQINFLLPFEVSDPVVTLVVSSGGADSTSYTLNIGDASPGVFTVSQAGSGPAAALHPDFTPISSASPARAGEVVAVFCTGLGAVNPAVASGVASPSDPLSKTIAAPVVTIGGLAATVEFSGLAPGFAGLYQINARIPASVQPGAAVPLIVNVGSNRANPVTIAVQ